MDKDRSGTKNNKYGKNEKEKFTQQKAKNRFKADRKSKQINFHNNLSKTPHWMNIIF